MTHMRPDGVVALGPMWVCPCKARTGKPCRVAGAGVCSSHRRVIAKRFLWGATVDRLAFDLGVHRLEIEQALREHCERVRR